MNSPSSNSPQTHSPVSQDNMIVQTPVAMSRFASSQSRFVSGTTDSPGSHISPYGSPNKSPDPSDTIKSSFKHIPQDLKEEVRSIPNSIFIRSAPLDYHFEPTSAFNTLTNDEFAKIMEYFITKNQALRHSFFRYQTLQKVFTWISILISIILASSLFTSKLPLYYSTAIFYSLIALIAYFTLFLYSKTECSKIHLLYNFKAFLLQLNIQQLKEKKLMISCDQDLIFFSKHAIEEAEADEFLLDISAFGYNVPFESNAFQYIFTSKMTNISQKDGFNSQVTKCGVAENDFLHFWETAKKQHRFSAFYLKYFNLPGWLVKSLFPTWQIIYMIIVFGTIRSNTPLQSASLGLLAPIYTLILPVAILLGIHIVFKVIPEEVFKPKIGEVIENESRKLYSRSNIAVKLNIHNDGIIIFLKSNQGELLPSASELPLFIKDEKAVLTEGAYNSNATIEDGFVSKKLKDRMARGEALSPYMKMKQLKINKVVPITSVSPTKKKPEETMSPFKRLKNIISEEISTPIKKFKEILNISGANTPYNNMKGEEEQDDNNDQLEGVENQVRSQTEEGKEMDEPLDDQDFYKMNKEIVNNSVQGGIMKSVKRNKEIAKSPLTPNKKKSEEVASPFKRFKDVITDEISTPIKKFKEMLNASSAASPYNNMEESDDNGSDEDNAPTHNEIKTFQDVLAQNELSEGASSDEDEETSINQGPLRSAKSTKSRIQADKIEVRHQNSDRGVSSHDLHPAHSKSDAVPKKKDESMKLGVSSTRTQVEGRKYS